jgi:hypothetical protein
MTVIVAQCFEVKGQCHESCLPFLSFFSVLCTFIR